MADTALTQLLEMGIPCGRARAALKRAKGDAMAAAVSREVPNHVWRRPIRVLVRVRLKWLTR
jgi:hypothetical protein